MASLYNSLLFNFSMGKNTLCVYLRVKRTRDVGVFSLFDLFFSLISVGGPATTRERRIWKRNRKGGGGESGALGDCTPHRCPSGLHETANQKNV